MAHFTVRGTQNLLSGDFDGRLGQGSPDECGLDQARLWPSRRRGSWMVPTSLSRALMSAVGSPALISRFSRLMISPGVPAGAEAPIPETASCASRAGAG